MTTTMNNGLAANTVSVGKQRAGSGWSDPAFSDREPKAHTLGD